MEKLQNNFTTVEQSKRLLELGIPVDSADCYWNTICNKPIPMQYGILYSDKRNQFTKENVPVWSVGRLQEIAKICAKEKEYYYTSLNTVAHQKDFVEWWVKYFTLTDNVLFDFSKLEK